MGSQSGWDQPSLFAIISYCGYAISAACLGVAVVLLMRSLPHPSARTVTEAGTRPVRDDGHSSPPGRAGGPGKRPGNAGVTSGQPDRASDDGRIGGLVG